MELKRPIYGEEAWSFVDYSALTILYTWEVVLFSFKDWRNSARTLPIIAIRSLIWMVVLGELTIS
jgi:hypothetical protein